MPPSLTRLLTDSRGLATLAVPLALTQLAQVALTTTDTIMMGLIGTEALAAGGLALVIFNQLRTMGVGLVTAVGNQVAAADARAEAQGTQAEGAEAEGAEADAAREEVRDLVRASLLLSTLAGLAGALLMVAIGHAVVFLGQAPDVVDAMKPVLYAMAPGLLPCLWFQAIRQFTVGMRRPQALLRITIASIAVNAGLNWVFIHGTWGLPKLGLPGIGLATTSVYALSAVALYLSARRDPRLAPVLSLSIWKTRPATLRRLTGLGAPIAATYGSEAGFFSVVALLVGSFGTAALAAHTAVNQLVYIVFQIAVGLSHAASLGVSRELALGDTAAARRLKSTALACAAAVMAVVAIVYVVLPGAVLAPFFEGDSRAATDLATNLLLIAAVMQFFDCAQNIGVGLLRGLDDTKGGFRVTLVGYWLVGLPAAALLGFATGWDTIGIWLGLLTGLATTALLLLRRFNRGIRLHVAPTAVAAT